MTTLASVRALVRQDLHDEDNTAYLWTDAVLDRHITHAVSDYSLACPLEQKSTLSTTAGSRDLSTTSLTDLIAIERVEWPTGSYPPEYVAFALWADTLTLDVVAAPASVQNVYVYWTKKHALGASSTIPTEHEDLIAVGAVAYAATDRETLAMCGAGTPRSRRDASPRSTTSSNASAATTPCASGACTRPTRPACSSKAE